MKKTITIAALLASCFAQSLFANTTNADEIDVDIALFEEICVSSMPDIEPVRLRAKSEGWPELDEADRQAPYTYANGKTQQGWGIDKNGVRYSVRVGGDKGNFGVIRESGSRSDETVQLTSAHCSLETKRGAGQEFLRRLEQKFGPSQGPALQFLSPKGATEDDALWHISKANRKFNLILYRPTAEQLPGARIEIAFAFDNLFPPQR